MIKVDTYGDSAKSSTVYILIYHVNVQINKIPQLAMELHREMGGGMIPQGIGRGFSQTLEPIGCDQMSMGKPMNPHLPFCPLSSIIDFFQNLLRQLTTWEKQGLVVLWLD